MKARWTAIIISVAVAIVLIPFVHSMMLNQSLTYTTIKSSNDSLTINYIVALYLYGVGADRLSKRIGKKKAWLLWGVGLVIILLTLRYVFGWEARW